MDNRIDFGYRQEFCHRCAVLQNIIQQETEKHDIHIEKYENIIYHQDQQIQRLQEIIDWLKFKLSITNLGTR